MADDPKKTKKPAPREWHGCTVREGHLFNEGVCEDCGMDLRIASERKTAEGPRHD